MKEKWKYYLSLLPFVSLVAIGFGYLHIYKFYSKVGIDVFAYISASEIFLAFIPHLPFIIVIAVATSASIIFSYAVENFVDLKIKKIDNKYYKFILHIISFGIIAAIMFFYVLLPKIKSVSDQFLLAIAFIILIVLVLLTSKGIKSNFQIVKVDYFIVIFYLIIITWKNASNSSNKIISENSTIFNIETKESKYDNYNYIYYGRLRDYSFLIQSKDSATIVINNKLIIKEEIKR